ncbi:MAG: hypothetical protein ABEJ27_03315 [Halodesulfurarchaeum sp.]
MARIQFEDPDGNVVTEQPPELNFDDESGHWILLDEAEGTLTYVPRERVFQVDVAPEEVAESGEADPSKGW